MMGQHFGLERQHNERNLFGDIKILAYLKPLFREFLKTMFLLRTVNCLKIQTIDIDNNSKDLLSYFWPTSSVMTLNHLTCSFIMT